MAKTNIIKRLDGIDIIKVLAFLFVLGLHYTNYFYVDAKNNFSLIFQNSFHWLFFNCIGLFLLTTGFLQNNKELNKKFISKWLKIIITFLIYSVITGFIIDKFDGNSILDIPRYTYKYIKKYFFGFYGYFWYANFFIGFMLLIPFLSTICKNINLKQMKNLIIILFFLIVVPNFLHEFYDFSNFFKRLNIKTPTFFSNDTFCFIYYFIGAYICLKNEKISKRKKIILLILLIGTLILHGFIDYYYLRRYSYAFSPGHHVYTFHEYGNIFTIITSICIFLLLKDINIKNNLIKRSIQFLSNSTFELYLGLIISDKLLQLTLNKLNYKLGMDVKSAIMFIVVEFIASFTILLIEKIIYSVTMKILVFLKNIILKLKDRFKKELV